MSPTDRRRLRSRQKSLDFAGAFWTGPVFFAGIIASFLLPRLPLFRFLNFALVNPALSIGGVILCIAGVAFLVWARQSLGKNWGQTVAAKVDHELLTSGPSVPLRPAPMYAGGTPAAAGSAMVCGGARYFHLSSSAAGFSGAWARKTN